MSNYLAIFMQLHKITTDRKKEIIMFRKNVWIEKIAEFDKIMSFAEGYKDFLNQGKTERECTLYAEKALRQQGFLNLNEVSSLKSGDKVYIINRGKSIVAFIVGQKPLMEGLHVLGAHIDSPRLDIKQNPLYESGQFTYLDTHYYGGIKKYQWTAIPLAIHGVITKKDGTKINIVIGEDENDPVFGITDLLPHLAKDQMNRNAGDIIAGEKLDITFSHLPMNKNNKPHYKDYILNLLKQKYGVEEEDFISSELEIVPAFKAKDYGLDRSMIASYGQDDRSCAYICLKAILDAKVSDYTSMLYLSDKEEIGSVGSTGAESRFFVNSVAKLAEKLGHRDPYFYAIKALENSKALSVDVSAAYDPLFAEVYEEKNSSLLGYGVTFNKYTGSRGKSGSNDANAEFVAYVRKIMDDHDVAYQTAELGKVDQGGGGTIAFIFANHNMDVIDAGVGVLNMHSPMEITSKADIYEGYLGYKAFLEAK